MSKKKIIDIPEEYRPEISELPGLLSDIAEILEEIFPGQGVVIALAIGQRFGGQAMYIHGIEKLLRRMRDDAIRREYDRGNITMRELAMKWDLSLPRIKQILAETGAEKTDDRQLRMF